MSQHFLLSSKAKTLRLADVLRMTDAEAETAFRKVRWNETEGASVCPSCGGLDAYLNPPVCWRKGHKQFCRSGPSYAEGSALVQVRVRLFAFCLGYCCVGSRSEVDRGEGSVRAGPGKRAAIGEPLWQPSASLATGSYSDPELFLNFFGAHPNIHWIPATCQLSPCSIDRLPDADGIK